ncbi:MAG: hypothetical protein L6R40_003447 [Gallowayella cf. fulva]|nr:MAG: hypothetical protein L6R40_003447 [Xanthomendoza cf. fulva]
MHLSLWIAAAGLLRVLPSCTASPIAAAAKPVAAKPVAAKPVAAVTKPVSVGSKQTSSSSSSSCGNASTTGVSADCWTTLGMNHYLSNWTDNTVIANAPMIGTIVCRSNEPWAQCFIRFAYGQQQKTAAPIDCSNPSSTSCKPPADMVLQPDSAEDYYGLYAIYAIFTYLTTLISALLTTTGHPSALQSIYTSANAGAGASSAPNPIDATIFQLLFRNGFSSQDTLFAAYLKTEIYAGNFTKATTDPPEDKVLYEGLVGALKTRASRIMRSWQDFEAVLGSGDVWMGGVQTKEQFVESWTGTGTTAAAATS